MSEDEITHIRELLAKRNVTFGCAPALRCPPLDKGTRDAINAAAPTFVACRDAVENLTCASNLASGRSGCRAEHDAVKRIMEKICTRCWRGGMSVDDATAGDDVSRRYDGYGFSQTERVIKAYSDVEKNNAFIRQNWPYSDLDPDTKIRRFTTVEYLRKMLRSRKNYLASVLTWPDVYEGLSRSIKQEDQNHHAIDWSNISTSFYGQCWTMAEFDSEAKAGGYQIFVDTKGTLTYPSSSDNRLCLLSGQASSAYLKYLESIGYSYIVCGKERIDFERAVEILAEKFNVKRLAVVGGGRINGAFLSANLLDEISVMIAPGIDGRTGEPNLFDGLSDSADPIQLELTSCRQMKLGTIWAKYKPKRKEIR